MFFDTKHDRIELRGKKGSKSGGPKKKLGVLKGKMIIKNEILGMSRCFLIPNMSKLKSGKKEPIYAERCDQKITCSVGENVHQK